MWQLELFSSFPMGLSLSSAPTGCCGFVDASDNRASSVEICPGKDHLQVNKCCMGNLEVLIFDLRCICLSFWIRPAEDPGDFRSMTSAVGMIRVWYIYLWAGLIASQHRLHRWGNLGAAEQLWTRVWKAQADCSQISSDCPCSGGHWAPTMTPPPREIELSTFWQFSCSRDQLLQLEGRQHDLQGPILYQTVWVVPH